ncbi:MAG: hypothetical protein IPL26_19615 [Leptospiraceae bacterium]|nr:hypothetical protein [Leptospiraceae bacterium]
MLRRLFVKIGLDSGDTEERLKRVSKEVDKAKAEFEKFGGKSGAAMRELAKATGQSEKTIQSLINSTQKEIAMERQFKKAALAVGLTEKEVDRLNSKLKDSEKSTANFVNVFKGLAALGVTAFAYGFANKAIDESNRAENALIGFNTVIRNTLGKDKLEETTKGVENLFKKLGGSMDMSSIQMSVKNLVNSGFSAQQAIDLVEKNAYMASVNRQGQFKTIAEAVQVYTEGIKNNNAMRTDSTGISENLSVTLKKKGLSMDDLNNKMKRELVLQTIYNSHVKEASAYQGAYTSQMAGYQGQVIKANSAMSKILETSGDFIKKGLTPLLAMANPVLAFFTDSERGSARTAMALSMLTTLIGVGLVGATWSWVASLNAVAIAKAVAFAEIIGIALAVTAALTAVYLVFEDIWVFLEYGPKGSETFFGEMLTWLGLTGTELQALSDGFHEFKTIMSEAWENLKAFADSPAGQFMIKLAKWAAIAVAVVAFFPIVVVAAFATMSAYIIAKWNQITAFLKKTAILTGKILLAVLFPIAGVYIFRKEIAAAFAYLWNLVTEFPFVQKLISQFMSLKERISAVFSGMWESLKSTFQALLPIGTINTLIDGLNFISRKLNEFSSSKAISLLGISPLSLPIIPNIEQRALGGPINSGQPYLVGERGPELVVPRNDGNVIPNNRLQGAGNSNMPINISVTVNSGATNASELSVDLFDAINEVFKKNADLFRVQMNMEPTNG